MSAAKIRRGSAAKRPKPRTAARSRRRKGSRIDALLRQLPVSVATLQRIATFAVIGVLVVVAIVAANLTGVSAKAHEELTNAVALAGFEVRRVEVVGVDRVDQMKIYDIALNQQNRSMAAVDLDAVRSELMRYGWIADARVSRRLPDTLVVDIVERKPSAVWQSNSKLALIDKDGVLLERVTPGTIPDLPLVVGPNANRQTKALDNLLEETPALRPLLTGATWVGNRRWDLRFQTGEVLMLPEGVAESTEALKDFARMEGVDRLLGRGIIRFDMRDPEKMVLLPGRSRKPADSAAQDAES